MGPAVVVIDMQRGLLGDPPGAWDVDAVVERINSLTARARDAGVPVILVQHERPGTVVEPGTEGWMFHPDLVVAEHDAVVAKTTPDSFLGTTLSDALQTRAVERLIVCGYASEFCVDTTVRRAAALGYPVTLVADAHTTHDKPHASAEWIRAHENATLPEITSFGPRIAVSTAADVVFEVPAGGLG